MGGTVEDLEKVDELGKKPTSERALLEDGAANNADAPESENNADPDPIEDKATTSSWWGSWFRSSTPSGTPVKTDPTAVDAVDRTAVDGVAVAPPAPASPTASVAETCVSTVGGELVQEGQLVAPASSTIDATRGGGRARVASIVEEAEDGDSVDVGEKPETVSHRAEAGADADGTRGTEKSGTGGEEHETEENAKPATSSRGLSGFWGSWFSGSSKRESMKRDVKLKSSSEEDLLVGIPVVPGDVATPAQPAPDRAAPDHGPFADAPSAISPERSPQGRETASDDKANSLPVSETGDKITPDEVDHKSSPPVPTPGQPHDVAPQLPSSTATSSWFASVKTGFVSVGAGLSSVSTSISTTVSTTATSVGTSFEEGLSRILDENIAEREKQAKRAQEIMEQVLHLIAPDRTGMMFTSSLRKKKRT